MKKTLLALTALAAFAGVAHAQSTVSIYGQVETSVSRVNDGTSVLSGVGGTGQAKGDVTGVNGLTSRLGFKGSEDLGNGLKAIFQLEHRFTNDDGAQNGAFFHGRSVVGLQGSFGEIVLGRDYAPVYAVAASADPFGFDSTVGQLGAFHQFAGYSVGNYGVASTNGSNRMNNAVVYTSPEVQGLKAKLSLAGAEGIGKREVGGSLTYNRGALSLGLGLDQFDSNNKLTVVTGGYDLGFVKPAVSYSKAEVGGLEADNWTISATAPLGAGVVKAAYAKHSVDTLNVDTAKFALGYEYGLSKRTSVFTDVGSAKTDGLTRTTGLDVGLRHKF